MILVYLLIILLGGGLLSWIIARWSDPAARWISLLAVLADLVISIVCWIGNYGRAGLLSERSWLVDLQLKWIPQFGISFHLAMDGLSMVMTVLTLFLGALSILASWKEITKNTGFFHFNVLWLLAGILGVFLSMDLFLFYFFWEVMLIPMYFIIGIWGQENRRYAGIKFFLFTQLSGLLMLIAILGLYFIHGSNTGNYTFDYFDLLGASLPARTAFWLMCGFLIAFVVKLPIVPFHSWLPDAYTQSPTGGSVILAALMSKTGAYGMLRFVLPLFPEASRTIAPLAILLGVVGILYGAKLAFAQTDLKRLISFSSLSHMGFIMVGIFSFQALALQGTVLQMVAHALSIGALFIIAGMLGERVQSRDMNLMGGFWDQMPKLGGITLLFVMASVGLPGLANFVAEFLILAGAWQTYQVLAILATLGLIVSVFYSLIILQKIFHGEKRSEWKLPDLSARELVVMACLIVVIVWLGFFPQPVIRTVFPSMESGESSLIENGKLKIENENRTLSYHENGGNNGTFIYLTSSQRVDYEPSFLFFLACQVGNLQ